MKKVISLFLAAAITFTLGGCSSEKKNSAADLPADTPWNRFVMETDSGYYYSEYSYNNILSLRYTEKSNGASIYLCAKPECAHRGEESCTATYKHLMVSNYILYNDSIYFAADTPTEDTMGISVYKASLDGSALDKLCDIRRVKHAYKDEEFRELSVQRFIIHKGYAYIPYNIGGGYTYTDFIESGFAKVDVLTGKVELIFSDDKFTESVRTHVDAGIGDYIYYSADSSVSSKNGYFRYDINSGESEKITGEVGKLLEDRGGHYGYQAITDKTIYLRYIDRVNGKPVDRLIGYDAKTFEPNGFDIDVSDEEDGDGNSWAQINFYNGKIYAVYKSYIKVYSEDGEQVGGCKWCEPPKKNENAGKDDWRYSMPDDHLGVEGCAVSDEKLYILFSSSMELNGLEFDESTREKSGYEMVYSCPLEDVINGTGKFTKAYRTNW